MKDICSMVDKYYIQDDYKIDNHYIYKIERLGNYIININCSGEYLLVDGDSHNVYYNKHPLITLHTSDLYVATKTKLDVLLVRYVTIVNLQKNITPTTVQ
jgi:hypothetical protein